MLAGDVGRAEDPRQAFGQVARRRGVPVELAGRRRLVARLAHHRRPAAVEKLHRQLADLVLAILELQPPGGQELADHRGLDPFAFGQLGKRLPLLGSDGQHHSLLGLGDPDFGVGQPLVLQRHAVEPDFGADRLPHFADGARKAAGAAVGNSVIQPPVAGREDHVEQHLFGDRIADLHGAAREAFALVGQLGRAERGAVDAVAARASADGHDIVVGLRLLERLVTGNQPHGTAIDQRIAEIALVEVDRAVDGGNAHAVAVVAHSGHHALHDAARVQRAGRHVLGRRLGRGKAKHVGVANRPRAKSGAERIANHAAHARVGPAVGFQRRRMVVGLDLEHQVVLVVEADHAGVVGEYAHAPVIGAQRAANFAGGREDRLLEHVVEPPRALGPVIIDAAGQGLVAAMLAPGLGDRLQLDVGRIAIELAKMCLDGPHLGQRQVELPLAAEPLERRVVGRAQRHADQAEFVGRAELEPLELQRAHDHLLDGVVGQHLAADGRQPLGLQVEDPILAQRADRVGRESQVGNRRLGACATGSMTPGLSSTWTTCQSLATATSYSSAPAGSTSRGWPTAATTLRSATLSVSSSRAIRVASCSSSLPSTR